MDILEKRIEGEIERRLIEERKLKDKITDLERRLQNWRRKIEN